MSARPTGGRHFATPRWAVGLGLFLAASAGAAGPVTIGVVLDGPWEGNDRIRELTVSEIQALVADEFEVDLPLAKQRVGDWTYEGASAHLDDLLADDEVDLVLAWGMLASEAVSRLAELPKPVVAPVVLDRRVQGMPYEAGASGRENLSYVELPTTLAEEIRLFRRVVPFERLAVLVNAELVRAVPELPLLRASEVDAAGVTLDLVPVGFSASEALAALPEGVDAVYAWPQLQLSEGERQALVAGLTERRLPSFASLGGPERLEGALASAGAETFFPRLARRVALNVQRIVLGEEAGTIPVAFAAGQELTIDLEVARTIGVSPTYEALLEARLLNERPHDLPRRTLEAVVHEAVLANLDLAVQQRAVEAGARGVERARAALRPQIELGAQAVVIDEDRASASFGSQSERTLVASADLEQVLYSEALRAETDVQQWLQEGREHEIEGLRLDIALEAATTYLNLLRALSLVDVLRTNVGVTRSNLELAEMRRRIGAASSAEVFRWQSQVALDRKELIEATADIEAAEIALNRILHRDPEEPFVALPVSAADSLWITGQNRFQGYTETPMSFRTFRDFIVQEGITTSPELAALATAVAAQERTVDALRRSRWAPDLALLASWDEVLERGGVGAEPPSFGLPGVETVDDSSWSAALGGSFDLLTGGGRSAAIAQAELDLERLRLEYSAAVERLDERIRTLMQRARASYLGIDLSQQAADAAQRNFELVSDAYARGVVSILDLLDAQAAALNASAGAASAEYDFLIDLLAAQRAANSFDFGPDAVERDAWFQRLDRFFAARGIERTTWDEVEP